MRKGFVFVFLLGMVAGVILLLLAGAKIVFPELTISKETVSRNQVVEASKKLIEKTKQKIEKTEIEIERLKKFGIKEKENKND
jgi:uncharacterized membrane protein required for colicin V production